MELDATLADLAPGLLRYCAGRTGCRQTAEDVAQEALGALVARWRRHGPPEDCAAFVYAVARRRAGRAVWKRRLLWPLEAVLEVPSEVPGPAQRAEDRDRLEAVRSALGRLSNGDREVLLRVAAGELDVARTAKALGLSRSAVKMRLHRARRRLAAQLEATNLEATNREEGHEPLEQI